MNITLSNQSIVSSVTCSVPSAMTKDDKIRFAPKGAKSACHVVEAEHEHKKRKTNDTRVASNLKSISTRLKTVAHPLFDNRLKSKKASSSSPSPRQKKPIISTRPHSLLLFTCCQRREERENEDNSSFQCASSAKNQGDTYIATNAEECNPKDDQCDQPNIEPFQASHISHQPSHWEEAVQKFWGVKSMKCRLPYIHDSEKRLDAVLPHVRQEDTWDCGVACMQMIVQWWWSSQRKVHQSPALKHNLVSDCTLSKLSKQWMLDMLGTVSIWTIDLVMLIERINAFIVLESQADVEKICASSAEGQGSSFSSSSGPISPHNLSSSLTQKAIRYMFCSSRLGVDDCYNNFEYYKKAFTKDEIRVKELFVKAERDSLPMLEISHLGLNQVIDLVSREDTVAIVLLDNSIFSARSNGTQFVDMGVTNSTVEAESFVGHYVILAGICYEQDKVQRAKENEACHCHDLNEDNSGPASLPTTDSTRIPSELVVEKSSNVNSKFCMAILDPGRDEAFYYATPRHFEKSWRAKGTDQDIIFLAI